MCRFRSAISLAAVQRQAKIFFLASPSPSSTTSHCSAPRHPALLAVKPPRYPPLCGAPPRAVIRREDRPLRSSTKHHCASTPCRCESIPVIDKLEATTGRHRPLGNFSHAGSPLHRAPLSAPPRTTSSVSHSVPPSRPRAHPWCRGARRLPQRRSPPLLQPATVNSPPLSHLAVERPS
jgi:hypothetical protein